jgi:hypothetical protein
MVDGSLVLTGKLYSCVAYREHINRIKFVPDIATRLLGALLYLDGIIVYSVFLQQDFPFYIFLFISKLSIQCIYAGYINPLARYAGYLQHFLLCSPQFCDTAGFR